MEIVILPSLDVYMKYIPSTFHDTKHSEEISAKHLVITEDTDIRIGLIPWLFENRVLRRIFGPKRE
jgi:hypothetical protein